MRFYILSITIILIIVWLIAPINYLIKFTSDDSYFYLKVALNYANNFVSSFDTINPTNGYHPLWMFLLSGVFKLALTLRHFDEESLLRIVFIFTTLINSLSLCLLIKIFYKTRESKFNYIKISLLVLPLSLFYLIGLEVQIFILFLLIVIILFIDFVENKFNYLKWFAISFSLSFLILSRIDFSLYIIAALTLYIIFNKIKLLKSFFQILIIPFITSIIYLVVNKIIYGDYLPITGKYKLSFDIQSNLSFFPTPLKNPIDFMIVLLIVTGGIIHFIILSRIKSNIFHQLIKYIYLSSVLFLMVNYFLNYLGVREWYYVYALFPSVILLGLSIKGNTLNKVFFALLIVFNSIYFLLFRVNYYNHDSAYEFAKELKNFTSESDVIYQVDYSGIIGYFSSRKIVNGDGLINSFEYYSYLKKGELKNYLDSIKASHLIFYSFDEPIKDNSIEYQFRLLNYDYFISNSNSNIVLQYPFIYGGIFRKRFGNYYLIKIDEWNIRNNQ